MIDWSAALESLQGKVASWVSGAGEMLPNAIVALIVLGLSWILGRGLSELIGRLLARSSVNRAASALVTTLVRVFVVAAGLMVALGVLQLDKALTSILAGAGVVGLALGFAFQDVAANLISGVGLAVNRTKPFKIGDLVETNGEMGKVKAIDLRTSTIETLDGKQVVLPNKQIYQSKVINHSASGSRRVELECGVSYGEDMERVAEVSRRAISDELAQEVEVLWTGFGDSSIDFVARFWVEFESQKQFLRAKSRALVALKKAFDREDIMIPFPIRTLDFGIRGGVALSQALSDSRSSDSRSSDSRSSDSRSSDSRRNKSEGVRPGAAGPR